VKPTNLLFILSDEHQRDAAGCYGHPVAQTPNLDALAARGTRFASAYTPCPICVPARASLMTGRYVHQHGCWDNAFPYDGSLPSWAHRLRDAGIPATAIGKLHFRSAADDYGFVETIDPLHVVDGVGDLLGCLRDDPPRRDKRPGLLEAGPGHSTYLDYDARIAARAAAWLREHARDEKPWVLFVSFVCPHPPYIAPPRLFDRYPLDRLPLPPQWRPGEEPDHPALVRMREQFGYGPLDEALVRRVTAAYLGACTYLDERIGEVLQALDECGLSGSTRVLYTSDHGESLGARGLFGKFTMYEESAAVPLILAGPDVPAGHVVRTPASLIDCYPTILDAMGLQPNPADRQLRGESLWQMLRFHEPDAVRKVLSEYHAVNSQNAVYMLSWGTSKYVHYVGEPPQFFDLRKDPQELHNQAADPRYGLHLYKDEDTLRGILDPEAVDARAKADQQAKIEAFGGRDAVLRRGTFDNSPIPGEAPAFRPVR
jgi:choline-sulfatase